MPHVLVNGPASWNLLVDLDSLPSAGGPTLLAEGHREGIGGTSAGKALTLAALGVDVRLRTVLGNDEEGAAIRAALTRPRLQLTEVAARDGRTERHLDLMAADGERQSIYLELPTPDRELDATAAADLLVGVETVIADLADHSRPLLSAAHAAGLPLWCDVHDDDGVGEYARAFAESADVLLVSHARLGDPAAYLRRHVEAGCRLAVCTFGADGALALDANGWFEVGAAPVQRVVDSSGAGDAFFSGLLAATLRGMGTAESLAWASATGAIAVGTSSLGAPGASMASVMSLARAVPVGHRD